MQLKNSINKLFNKSKIFENVNKNKYKKIISKYRIKINFLKICSMKLNNKIL